MNEKYILEPINFFYSGELFKGLNNSIETDLIIYDIDNAFSLAFSQNISSEYEVWYDKLSCDEVLLRDCLLYEQASEFISSYKLSMDEANNKQNLEYRKKCIKKANTKFDDFMYSDAREDASYVLGMLSISRYLNQHSFFLEEVFKLYKCGGWPCGFKNGRVLIFDPNTLKE